MNIQWAVQRNLTNQNDFDQLLNACAKADISFLPLDIIPFSDALPEFDRSRKTVIYGSTTFNALALKDKRLAPGVFFDEQRFSIENYMDRWGRNMLNYGALITSFDALVNGKQFAPDKLLFIRPDDDSKSFAGEVKVFNEIETWYKSLKEIENTNLSPESKIVVSEPYNIKTEWRLWIVNKKVIAASKYREYFKLKKEEGCPESVTSFAEQRCQEYIPHDVFVMDVCLCGDEYYIVECNCMNGAGFYSANIDAIVREVTNYFQGIE